MLHYILQVIAFQLLFLLVYEVFLKRETFFNANRMYLLFTALVSLVLPFVELNLANQIISRDVVIQLPEVIIGQLSVSNPQNDILNSGAEIANYSTPILHIIFWIGASVSLVFFMTKIGRLFWLYHKHPKRWQGNLLIISLLDSSTAFSFFNRIFLGDNIEEHQAETIIEHETVHANQKHTVDLLIFEILRIVMWFNPLIYVYQQKIKTLHEYIADAKAVKHHGKSSYYQGLLQQIFETNTLSFTNSFYKQSLIKKRIVMLQKSKSKQSALVKYVLVIPVIFGMLFYVSCDKEISNNEASIDLDQFSYELLMGSKMNIETQNIHNNYEEFLKSNKAYVSWAIINSEEKIISYSVHHIDEKVPEGYYETEITGPDGRGYKSYMNFNYFDLNNIRTVVEEERINPRDFDGKPEVPFAVIDKVPSLEECDGLTTNAELKKCISREIAKHVNRNFNTDLATQLGLEGRQRISVGFKIDKTGHVIDVYARAPHPELENEAKRIINLLPQFTPGEHHGEKVVVPYGLPIVFQVQD